MMNLSEWLDKDEGHAARMAEHFSVTPAAVSHWKRHGVPLYRMRAVSAYTQGEVPIESMIPADQTES